MGRENFQLVYTDTSPEAGWLRTLGYEAPYEHPPAISKLIGYTDAFILSDMLHNWFLGSLRDLLGSTIKVLCKDKKYYRGSSIAKRLHSLFKEAKAFAAANGDQLSMKGLKKATLVWRGDVCPELKVSAHDAGVLHRYLAQKLQEKPPPLYPGLTVVLWAADSFISAMSRGSIFLTADEREHIYTTGWLFCRCYVKLANEAQARKDLLYKCRPKLHYIMHSLLEAKSRPSARNPMWDACWMDEDYIKWSMKMAKRMSGRTLSLNLLKRFRVVTRKMILRLRTTRPS